MKILRTPLLALGIIFTSQSAFAQHLTYEQKKHFANQKNTFWKTKPKPAMFQSPKHTKL